MKSTTINEYGNLIYRQRDDGKTIKRLGIPLDNRYVIPHN